MQNLLYLLVRYGGFLAFLAFEGLSLYLVVQYNRRQQEIYVSTANAVTGEIYNRYDNLLRYTRLSAVNDSLARENARLRGQLRNAQFEMAIRQDTVYQVRDSFRQQYVHQECRVINNSVSQSNNFLTINRGSDQGIRYGMGVISSTGIVGIVRGVSANFAQVMSVLHRQTRISASIRRNNFFGSLVWNGTDARHMTLDAIPKHADVVVGDTVQTSGYSGIFPGGIMIGTVESFRVKPGSSFYSIEVKLSNDLGNVDYVYVVENLLQLELRKLEKENSQ